MRSRIFLLTCLALSACTKPPEPSDSPSKTSADLSAAPVSDAQSSTKTPTCTRQAFAESVDLPEASGATLLADGTLLVVGDSDTGGAYAQLDASTGKLLSRGKLDLDSGASDDLEGLSRIGDVIYAIASSGWMRHFSSRENGFPQLVSSYPLATKAEGGLICKSAHSSNCAQNYEGLCLRADATANEGCAGFAAAKESGRLICLRLEEDGRLQLDASHSIEVALPKSLSACHFDKQNRMWFGTNLFAGNSIGFVEDWQESQEAKITRIGAVGIGFGEAIAVADSDQVFRFSDTSGSPSLLSKYICR